MWAIPYQLLGDYPAPSPEELGKKPSVLASQNKSLVERISLKPTEVILSPDKKLAPSPLPQLFLLATRMPTMKPYTVDYLNSLKKLLTNTK